MAELLEGKQAIGHLMRRAGFGHDPDSAELLAELPYELAVQRLVAGLSAPAPAEPEGFDPYVPGAIQQLWLERMVSGEHPLAERLALFWHGHFATSSTKVADPQLMWRQYQLFRSQGGGAFRDLVGAVSRDVAMIRWLDGNSNRKGHPNENYGRELQELFTLGIGNYTETDIREIARAFTGWGSRHHEFVYSAEFHDDGDKTIHGRTGSLGGEDVVELVTSLPACGRFLARKLLVFFSHPDPTAEEVAELASVFQEEDGRTCSVLEHLFLAPGFRDRRRHRALVKSPVEFMVGSLRSIGMHEVPGWTHGALDRMGQILFRPPSVKGWTSGTGWLSSSGVVERLRAAERLATQAPQGAAATLESVAFDGLVPDSLSRLLRRRRGRRRIALILSSPEFQLA